MTKQNSETLDELRSSIDKIDQVIVSAIGKRMKLVGKVGRYKKNKGIQPLDKIRWQQVLDSKKNLAIKHNLSPKLIVDIYNIMHRNALKIEEKI